jgi:2-oxoisovalerate dehydrogenase E1 component alpha subunit
MEYVRTERKPFLLEALVSRLYGHSSASGANAVADEADCLKGFEKRLEERKLLTRQQIEELRQKYAQELHEAHRKVRQEPQPKADTIYENVFMDRDKVREGN